jgi:hypothetical protein
MTRILLVELGAGALPAPNPLVPAAASWAPAVYVPPPVPVPGSFAAAGTIGGMALSWTAAAAASAQYAVERAPDTAGAPGAWVEVARVTELSYAVNAAAGTKYWWRVRTFSFGRASVYTSAEAATAVDAATPTAVANAQEVADDALSSANAANAALADIAADSKLTADEKIPARREYDELTGEQSGIDAQAAAYGITTERTNYNGAITDLKDYLRVTVGVLDGSNVWTNITGTTDIVRADWDTRWRAVYSTRQALLNKIVEKAKALADAAQSTANSRNRIFEGGTQPTEAGAGDLWRDTARHAVWRYNGSTWTFYSSLVTAKNLLVNPTGQHDFDGWTSWVGNARQRMTTRNEAFGKAFACDFADTTNSYDMGARAGGNGHFGEQRLQPVARHLRLPPVFGHRACPSPVLQRQRRADRHVGDD